MASIQGVKSKLQGLIDKANNTTENSDADLTAAVDSLINNLALDGSIVTFGYENGEPVEREEQYAIAGADLNELGKVTQKVSGKRALMTVADMIYWLNRGQFIPQGNAESVIDVSPLFITSAYGALQEG